MKYLFILFYFLVNILLSKDFSSEAYSKTTRDRVKVADNFIYENIETKGQWKDSEGQYGLFFCHGNIVSENSIKKVQSFCEYIDISEHQFWHNVDRFVNKKLFNKSKNGKYIKKFKVGIGI